MADWTFPGGVSLFSLVEPQLQQVRAVLRQFLADSHKSVRPLLAHGALDTGKLLRPGLLLLSGGAFGALAADHIQAATVVEVIHNATLVHDDVLDHGRIRRGVPTVNCRWDNPVAVRFGDILLSKVLELNAGLKPSLRATFSRMIGQTCMGEIDQTLRAGDFALTEPEYLAIIGQKTAALFEGACHVGALLANASPRECRAVARFGRCTGLAYQVMDDLLDIVGDGRALRKTLGTDLHSAKPTLPLIHALRVLGESARLSLQRKLEARALTRPELLGVLAAAGSLEYVLARIGVYVDEAAAAGRRIPPSPMQAALLEVPRWILQEAVAGSADSLVAVVPQHPASVVRARMLHEL